MKRIIPILSILVVSITLSNCKKKPLDNVKLNINSDIMKYRGIMDVFDATSTQPIPANAVVTISGRDADYIYDLAGGKDFSIHNGTISFGVSPLQVPTSSNPVIFDVMVSAPGYLPVTQEVRIDGSTKITHAGAAMINIANPPAGMELKQTTIHLSNGVLTQPGIIKNGRVTSDSVYYDDAITTVVLPKGTSFYYYKVNHKDAMGTYIQKVPQTKDGYQSGGATIYPDYYDTVNYHYDSSYMTLEPYTGSTINVVCSYVQGISTDLTINDNRFTGPAYDVTLLNGTKSNSDELLFKSATQKALTGIRFIGTVNGRSLDLSPDSASHWFTSLVLDNNIVNPVTNAPIQDGDSIEYGINPYTGKTLHTPVWRAPNGTLRAEVQAINVGYYYHAPEIYTFTYNLNGTVSPTDIPDVENLSGYAIVDLGVATYTIFIGMDGMHTYSAKVCSAAPITHDKAALHVSYWGQVLKNDNIQQQTVINVFAPPYKITLPDPIHLTYNMQCDEKAVWPTYDFTIPYTTSNDSGYFYCDMVNGEWTTRGLQQNHTYRIQGHMCDFSIDKEYTVTGTDLHIKDSIPEVCNCYFK